MLGKVILMLQLSVMYGVSDAEMGTQTANYLIDSQNVEQGYNMMHGIGINDTKIQFDSEHVIGEQPEIGDAVFAVWNDKFLNEDEFMIFKLK